MKSAVENLNPTRVKLTVEVPFDELKPSLDAAYKTIATQVQIPGFRRGKVPARIIDQRVGRGAVLEEAINSALPTFYGQAVEEAKIRPLGQPEVEITEAPDPASDGDLKFSIEVDVRPDVQVPDFSTLSVTVDDVAVADDDVDAEITALRQRFGTLVGVERAAAEGDFVSIDLKADIDGDEIDAVTGVSYEIGSKNMLEGLDEALVGMSAGETKTFTAPLAGGDREGQDAEVTVTVQSVKERELPELDDDFAQLASEFDTLDELTADIRGQVERAKKMQQGVQARDKVLDALLEAADIPVPPALVEAEVHSHLENENRLEDDEHRAEVSENATKALQAQFLLDAIVEQEKVSVTQPELVEYLVMSAQQYGMSPDAFAKAVDEAGQVQAMVAEVARRKALAVALEQAKVTDESGNTVDLEALRPQADEVADLEQSDEESDEDADEDTEHTH
ncbi:trigger factor [Angustibacter sp. Root456]|uniref:trigger factor n=1 Tax=Angustibacter sp. Root456 TaxID=1736539 RepID=UPI0006F62292|nr:trigger factor [Angustibacter sp. Root456]KQX68826.1 trigger factor [Angustibacter sp. Root456]